MSNQMREDRDELDAYADELAGAVAGARLASGASVAADRALVATAASVAADRALTAVLATVGRGVSPARRGSGASRRGISAP